MLLQSEFKADLFQLKHSRDANALLDSLKVEAAQALGLELVKQFPFEKVQAFEGVLPEMSLNKEHEFTDTYSIELVVLDAKVIRKHIQQLESDAEELIQERDSEDEANIRLGKAEVFKQLLL